MKEVAEEAQRKKEATGNCMLFAGAKRMVFAWVSVTKKIGAVLLVRIFSCFRFSC